MTDPSSGSWGSATQQGPDWWQASDGLWYPPNDPAPAPAPAGYPPTAPPGPGYSGYGYTGAPGPLTPTSKGRRFGASLLEAVLFFITLGIGWLIWWIIGWTKGQTPAKQVMKMRVVKVSTLQRASTGDMALRELVGKGILGNITFGITGIVSAFMILFGASGQGIWDKMAGTIVVDDPNGIY